MQQRPHDTPSTALQYCSRMARELSTAVEEMPPQLKAHAPWLCQTHHKQSAVYHLGMPYCTAVWREKKGFVPGRINNDAS
eukprot:IDg14836t1